MSSLRRRQRWVSTRRLRSLLTILGEAGELRDVRTRRNHLVAEVTRLIGASFVATVLDEDFHPTGRGRLNGVAAAGLDGSSSDLLAVLAAEGTARHPALRNSMARDDYREALVWHRRERASDRVWYRDSYFNDYVQPHHLDEGIFGGVRMSETTLLGVGAMRERRDSPFSDEDMALLEGYAHAARALWCERDAAAELAATLPPRLRRLLSLMLSGSSEKQMADELGLSWHTVHTYTRQLYRRLRVSSRAELMARAVTAPR
jgi:DNA-binding CsgD family transcriptional regulator